MGDLLNSWMRFWLWISLVSMAWSMSLQDSVTWYENHGFPFAKIGVDSTGKSQVVRGNAWVWGSLQRLDSGVTKRELLERIAGIQPGEPVDLSQLQVAMERMRMRSWLVDAEPFQLYRKARRNVLIPAIRIPERPASSLEGWFYWSEHFQGNLDLQLVNLRGTGRSYALSLLQKDSLRSIEGSAEEPFLFQTDWTLLVEGAWKQEGLASEWMKWAMEGQWDYGVWKWGVGGQWNGILEQGQWTVQQLLTGSAKRKSELWDTYVRAGVGQRQWMDSSQWVAEHEWYLHRSWWLAKSWAWVMDGYSRGLWPLEVHRAASEMLDLGYTEMWGLWPGSRSTLQVQGMRSGFLWKSAPWSLRLLEESGVYRGMDTKWKSVHQYGIALQSQQGSTQIQIRLFWEFGQPWGKGILAVGLRNEW